MDRGADLAATGGADSEADRGDLGGDLGGGPTAAVTDVMARCRTDRRASDLTASFVAG